MPGSLYGAEPLTVIGQLSDPSQNLSDVVAGRLCAARAVLWLTAAPAVAGLETALAHSRAAPVTAASAATRPPGSTREFTIASPIFLPAKSRGTQATAAGGGCRGLHTTRRRSPPF